MHPTATGVVFRQIRGEYGDKKAYVLLLVLFSTPKMIHLLTSDSKVQLRLA